LTGARVGLGFDVHPFAPGRPLVLGGVDVPAERGLAGHSDADALTHAVADALLGALALGDLGQHFPDTDPRWRGISSQLLLGEVVQRVRAAGGTVVNVDATVVAEGPRLAGWLDAMQKQLAATLGLAPGRVSVKAKRAEGLGALGRHEGIAAMAVALVEVRDGEVDAPGSHHPGGGVLGGVVGTPPLMGEVGDGE
jgi:2-C-methyl-D-erythritol 2,4-cyclodiphosphate synthase